MTDQLQAFREALEHEDNSALRIRCQELFANGISHKEILRQILSRMAGYSVSDPSWLPAASVINLSDSLAHVELQPIEDKHRVVAFGQKKPEFCRIERPAPVNGDIPELQTQFQQASDGNDWEKGERCLLGISHQSDIASVFRAILDQLLQAKYLGTTQGSWWAGVRHLAIGNAIHLWQEFGDNAVRDLICYVGARHCAKVLPQPNPTTEAAGKRLESEFLEIEANPRNPIAKSSGDDSFDEAQFRSQLATCDHDQAFPAITAAWKDGVSVKRLHLAILMECVERKLRGGFGSRANWDNLKRESQSTSIIRRAQEIDERLAFKAAYHAAWQICRHGNEGLADNLPTLNAKTETDREANVFPILKSINWADSQNAIERTQGYLARGGDVKRFMREAILWVRDHCCGNGYYAGQRGMIDAWHLAKDHPERASIPLALAGWMADYRNQHFNFRRSYGPIWGANLSSDGGLFALRSAGTRIYDTNSGKELMFFRGHPWRFAFHPNSQLLACGWEGGRLQIWDLLRRQLVSEWVAFPDDISGQFGDGKFWGLAFSPDGKLLAGCSRGCKEVRVWNTTSWELLFELHGHTHDRNESVTFSSDSLTIATGGNDGTVRVWNATNGKQKLVFEEHTDNEGRITAVDFHPDGSRMLSAEAEGELMVWQHDTGKVLASMNGEGYCNCARFTEDGTQIVSEHEGSIVFWDATTGNRVDSFEAIPMQEDDHTIFGEPTYREIDAR